MKTSWKQLEQSHVPEKIRRHHVYIQKGKIYYLERTGTGSQYLCIHGIAGTSVSFIDLLEYFPKDSRIVFLDLPGFGKSYLNHHPEWFTDDDNTRTLHEIINQFIQTVNLSDIHIVAHSLGAYISVLYAHQFPQQIRSLTLLSPAGLLSTLDNNGHYYALLFKSGFPYFYRWCKYLIYGLSWFLPGSRFLYYLVCYCDRKAFASKLISRLIYLDWWSSYWKRPVMAELLSIANRIPVSLIYGEKDNLTPYHQGVIAKALSSRIRLHCLPGGTHGSFSLIREHHLSCSTESIEPQMSEEKIEQIRQIQPDSYRSYWSLYRTLSVIQRLYVRLLNILIYK